MLALLVAIKIKPGYRDQFVKWRETVQAWFDGEPMRHLCSTVVPTDQAWQAVKP
jgi:hypothetical protein